VWDHHAGAGVITPADRENRKFSRGSGGPHDRFSAGFQRLMAWV